MENPAAEIFDHKWLDNQCIESGCQSLKIERLEAENTRLWSALKEANEVLRSAHSVASRQGAETNWESFTRRIDGVLKEQHALMFPKRDT